MDLRQLEFFPAIVEDRSIAAATVRLGVATWTATLLPPFPFNNGGPLLGVVVMDHLPMFEAPDNAFARFVP